MIKDLQISYFDSEQYEWAKNDDAIGQPTKRMRFFVITLLLIHGIHLLSTGHWAIWTRKIIYDEMAAFRLLRPHVNSSDPGANDGFFKDLNLKQNGDK
ncbi:MAG: hypothetical protein ACTHK0_05960 [Ginsengibacter sp.]